MTRRAPNSLAALLALAIALPASHAQQVIPLWPHVTPEPAQTDQPEQNVATDQDAKNAGHPVIRYTYVTKPTMTIYPPKGPNSGAAALVFPGGGYSRLSWDSEGTDTCDYLTSIGVTCILVKYRVPEKDHYPANPAPLEDAQQAMRITRAHAAEWHIKSDKIGVVGFSAGGNLAALVSTHPDDKHITTTPAAPDALTHIDARANFAILAYPAYLAVQPDMTTLDPTYTPNGYTPPTFLIVAENDKNYGKNAPLYYIALAAANVPAEFHVYDTGGHGFGTHPVGKPEEHWTQLVTTWLRALNIIPQPTYANPADNVPFPATGTPCPAPQPPQPGSVSPNPNPQTSNPACW